MNDTLSYLALGVVQGLTEFLPVSSTGHLIVARDLLGITTEHGLATDAVLHLATALAVLLYFRKDIARLVKSVLMWVSGRSIERTDRVLILALVLGTLPAVVGGFLFQDSIESVFRSPELVAYALLGGSFLFFVAERFATQSGTLSVKKGILIGLFQVLALIPGVSRSGATISGGLLLGMSREEAARFAFLLSFPVILGAGLVKFLELGTSGVLATSGSLIAFAAFAAFVSGLGAIHFLLSYLKRHTLDVFIVYRVALALVILFAL